MFGLLFDFFPHCLALTLPNQHMDGSQRIILARRGPSIRGYGTARSDLGNVPAARGKDDKTKINT